MKSLFVITGVNKGLGLCLLLEANNRELVFEGVSKSAKAKEIPNRTPFTQMNCADSDKVAKYWQRIRDQYGESIHVILINNAGKYHNESFTATETRMIEKIFQNNFFSSVNMTKGLLSNFKSGTIININSLAGLIPGPLNSVYGAAKAAQAHLYSAIRDELPPGKFRVLCSLNIRQICLLQNGLYH